MDIYFIYFYFVSLGPETYVTGIVRLKKRIENSQPRILKKFKIDQYSKINK